ncbi:MAG TPA: CPBP family intramembrane glutamic endopeptidase [Burkholderiaceae bacterium]|nr:CPBP family intramembrane glutamic endopeptidase [Burkholderiaceae bacterium]
MKSPLAAFITIAYTLSLALSLVVGLTGGAQSPLAFGFGVASMLVPAVATLVVVAMGAAAPSLGGSRPPLRYVPLALLLMPIVMHAVMLPVAAYLWGGLPWAHWLTPEADGLYHTPAARNWGVLSPGGLVARMAMNMAVGVAANSTLAAFEEIGWRGWMLPRLMERLSVRRAVALSALIWAFWHTPFALSGIHHLPGIPAIGVALTLPILIIGAGLVIGWLWVRTRSLWIVALAHGSLNNWGQYAFKLMEQGGPGGKPRDLIILAAGGLAVLAVGSLLVARGLSPARQHDGAASPTTGR